MESSIAEFLTRQSACELLPTNVKLQGQALERLVKRRCAHWARRANAIAERQTPPVKTRVLSGASRPPVNRGVAEAAKGGGCVTPKVWRVHLSRGYHTFSAFWL